MEYITEVQRAGRITIPVILRNELGLAEGSKLIIRRENDEITLVTQKQALDEAHRLLRQYIPESVSLVEELLKERRAETAREEQEVTESHLND